MITTPAAPEQAQRLTFAELSAVNRTRAERWHPGFPHDGWTGSDWSNAMAGEAGETCNIVKKLRRHDFNLQQAAGDTRADLLRKLSLEIGDTLLYLDLLAQHYGLDIAQCVIDTFNRVSVREQMPERLPAQSCTALTARWCPIHGTCACPHNGLPELHHHMVAAMNDPGCNLHKPESGHGVS